MEKETFIYSICDFYALKDASWSGALQTLEDIQKNNKEEELLAYLNELISSCYPDGIEETALNDFLWFDRDLIYKKLGTEEDE